MKNSPKSLAILLAILLIFTLNFQCEKDDDDDLLEEGQEQTKALSTAEVGIVGTWYYYSSSYSEYRCITFNSDRTACYFEISKLSSSATKGNEKCYTDWYVSDNAKEGTVYDVNIIGDNTGGEYWAGYTINTADWILRKGGSTAMQETTKITCDFCN